MTDKDTKTSEFEFPASDEQPKRSANRPVKAKVAASVALKSKLDSYIAERDMLVAKRAEHHENLVAAWGTKGADDVAMTVATHDAKLSALNTIVERATVEYRNAVASERAAEVETLKTEHTKLVDQRLAANDSLTALRQSVVNSQIASDSAARDFEGALDNATISSLNSQRTVDEIDAAYKSAQLALSESAKKLADLTDAQIALQKAQLDVLDTYHALLVNERRTAELSNLGN